ncbi:MAG: dipeptidase [Pseudomonadota bacterium]
MPTKRTARNVGRIAKHACVAGLLALAACSNEPAGQAPASESLEARAARVHEAAVVIDTEIDLRFDLYADETKDPAQEKDWQFTIPKMQAGGMDAAVFAVYVPQEERTPEGYAKSYAGGRKKLAAFQRMLAENPDEIELARTADDVERIVASGKRAAMLGMVNANVLGPELEWLDLYDDAGLVYIGFTHAGHNHLSDSARPAPRLGDAEAEHGGLSPIGVQLIAEMNRRGILVDVSQISAAALMQAADVSQAPIIASHSSVYALVPTARNITDEGLEAIKRTGGVIQVVAFRSFILDTYDELQAGIAKVREQYGLTPEMDPSSLEPDVLKKFIKDYGSVILTMPLPTVSQYVDHIEYAVNVIGIDHVGISSDFEHGGGIDGWYDVSEVGNVTRELLKRGYSEADAAKILGGNFLRVMREAQAVAEQLTAS